MKYTYRFAALLLCASLLFCGWPATVMGKDEIHEDTAALSDPLTDISPTNELSPAELLSHFLRQPLTNEETLWLGNEGQELLPVGLSLIYDSLIPHENLSLTFEGGKMTVSALPFTGETAQTLWTPVSVMVDGAEHPLSSDESGRFTAEIRAEGLVTVKVNYEATLTISKDNINALLNAAYDRGQAILSAYADYEKALADHAAATEAYNAYRAALQQYKSDLALYNAYLSEQKRYEERLTAYQSYLAEAEAYELKLTVYNAYLAEKAIYDEAYAEYTDFLANPAAYEQRYLAYRAWLADMDKINAQLMVMDSCYIGDSEGHVLMATLKGPTVATVVARQDELVSVGCDAVDISNADKATAALITLLSGYPKDGTDSERYTYYIRHYTDIRENVTLLYTSLARLYKNDAVPDILQMQGKKERYWQFVAQLYTLSCALEDSTVINPQWSIGEAKLTELLDDYFIFDDKNTAQPLSSYPAPMEEVTSPADMKKPTPPAVVEQPVAPLKVTEPTPPTEVKKPVMPPLVSSPGAKPQTPIFTENEQALAEVVKRQMLTPRALADGEFHYPLFLTVETSGNADGTPVASFYSYDRMTLLSAVLADTEGTVAFPTDIPSRPAEAGLVYTFNGWMDHAGVAYAADAKLASITQDTCFYTVYTTEKEIYTVTWDVEGTLTQATYAFGELPNYDGTPAKAEDSAYVYIFEGWSPAITPATKDVTYTAVFTAHPRFYEIGWVIGDVTETDEYSPGELPTYPEIPSLPMDGRYRYVFKGWTPEITEVTEDAIYTALFEAVDLLQGVENALVTEENGTVTISFTPANDAWIVYVRNAAAYAVENGCGLTLKSEEITLSFSEEDTARLAAGLVNSVTAEGTDGRMPFRLLLKNEQGEELSLEMDVRLLITPTAGQDSLMTETNGTVISVTDASGMHATVSVGMSYTLQRGHKVNVEATLSGTPDDTSGLALADVTLAIPGQTVTLQVTPAPGFGIHNAVVHDQWGDVIPCTDLGGGKYSFTMPNGSVNCTADFIRLTYKVTFMADGQLVSSAVYHYGDEPTVPADPVRANDAEYSYTFAGWSPAVTTVMGDAVYEARFIATPLRNDDSVVDSGIGLLELFFIGFGAFAVSCVGILVPYLIVSKKKSVTAEAETEITESET